MRLDVPTLIVAYVAISVSIGVPLASISGRRRGTGALWYWSLALLSGAAGGVLLVLRAYIPVIISVMAGNALVVCSIALVGEAAGRMTERHLDHTNRWFFAVATAPVLGMLYLAVDEITPRFIYMASVEALLVGQLAWQLRSARLQSEGRHHPAALTIEVLLWILLAETATRTAAFMLLPQQETFFGQLLLAVAFLFAIVLVAVGTCVMIWHELSVKDAAIHQVKTTDIDSGLPNRSAFIELLGSHLAAGKAGEAVALVRLRPLLEGGGRPDPFEEVALYRNVGIRIGWGLGREDLLARFGGDEFIALLAEGDAQRQRGLLTGMLAELRATQTQAEQGRHRMEGAAVIVACDATELQAWQLIGVMRSALDRLKPGEVQLLAPADYLPQAARQ
ncbi:MAG: hypothetical protein ACRET8_03230 [Burkholderiales bacterium]